MSYRLPPIIKCTLLLLCCCFAQRAGATHIIGGEMTYKYLGTVAGGNKYEISLTIYEDCHNGSQAAIDADNPAFMVVYDSNKNRIYFDSAYYSTSETVPTNFNISCVLNPPIVCLLKKTFIKDFVLPPNNKYTVAYQRCCRNAAIVNIESPGGVGATYLCEIPDSSMANHNDAAIFKNYPPQIICANNPLYYDNSATDADGDSLSYELCSTYTSPNGLVTSTIPDPPPYVNVVYIHPPYSYYNPITGSPPLQIDPVTGMVSCTPLWTGRYLVTVCCHEWRHGIMINTVHREFQFVVTPCSKTIVADMPYHTSDPNIYKLNCINYTINFENTSLGSSSWHWDFGVPGAVNDTSSDFEPVFVYPDSGTYTVKLIANPGTPCADSIEKLVRIYPTFHAAFTDSGLLCPGLPLQFTDRSTGIINKVVDWRWNFGDGDSSFAQNNTHTFTHGGTYNVMLISENEKECIDTVVRQIIIEQFKPYAGNDTIIVKGEQIQFAATGGNEYAWSPSSCLDDPDISNPIGTYPDTGIYDYSVTVISSYGCTGYDTVRVWVVNQAAFYVPTGFSPNGDGKNDIFKPVAVGYRSLNFFRVFNRWGQEVYAGDSLEEGWDGTINHKKAELGTYFWEISYVDRFGKGGFMKGDVTLVR